MIQLFHGSDVSVANPKVEAGRARVDFGRGFYLSSLSDQDRCLLHSKPRFLHHKEQTKRAGPSLLSTIPKAGIRSFSSLRMISESLCHTPETDTAL